MWCALQYLTRRDTGQTFVMNWRAQTAQQLMPGARSGLFASRASACG
jgi:hypothetical protein